MWNFCVFHASLIHKQARFLKFDPFFFSIFLIFDSFLIGYLNLLAPWSILWKWTFALKKKIIRTYFKSDVCIARRFPRTLWFLDTSSWLSLSLAYTFNVFTHVIVHQLSVGLGKHQIHRDHCLFLPLWSLRTTQASFQRLSSTFTFSTSGFLCGNLHHSAAPAVCRSLCFSKKSGFDVYTVCEVERKRQNCVIAHFRWHRA